MGDGPPVRKGLVDGLDVDDVSRLHLERGDVENLTRCVLVGFDFDEDKVRA